jgi:hypothetical protein
VLHHDPEGPTPALFAGHHGDGLFLEVDERLAGDVVQHDVQDVGAPSGATGCIYGAQSGTESRMSMSIVPWNGLLISLDLASLG